MGAMHKGIEHPPANMQITANQKKEFGTIPMTTNAVAIIKTPVREVTIGFLNPLQRLRKIPPTIIPTPIAELINPN